MPGLIQAFQGQAGSQGTIPDDGNDFFAASGCVSRHGHAQGSGNRGAGMPDIEAVIDTLFSFGKTAQAMKLAQTGKFFPPTGNQFMGIRLMANVPDDFIPGRFKDRMQGQGQLHNAQRTGEMTTRPGHGRNNFCP